MSGFRFEPRATSFRLENAQQLAAAAELAYQGEQAIGQQLNGPWGLPRWSFFDISDTQAFVAADDRLILVCFRGTQPDRLEDWITDARAELVDGPLGGRVHAGFYDALSHVWQQLNHQVSELDEGRQKALWVTGHSLGAALATLATARWLEAGRPVQGLYTFGQPRTGDEAFARNFNFAFKPYAFRIVNHNDLVTRIPPRSFGYSHLGTFKYLTEAGQLVDDIGWWQRFLDRWQGAFDDFFNWAHDGINDHSMANYRNLLDECAWRLIRIPEWNQRWQRFLDRALRRAA